MFLIKLDVLPDLNAEEPIRIPILEITAALQFGVSDSYSEITANHALKNTSELSVQQGTKFLPKPLKY